MSRLESTFLQGWGDALLDASIVTGVGLTVGYLGVGDMVGRGIMRATGLPVGFGSALTFGSTVFITVFVYDLVQMYTKSYK